MSEYYYIASGEGNKIYTLRHYCQEWVGNDYNGGYIDKDSYVRNLSIDPVKAYAKAIEYVGDGILKGVANLELNDYKSRKDNFVWDGTTMCYGNKYYGCSISDIVKDESGVKYLAEEYGFPYNPRSADIKCKEYIDSLPEVKAYIKAGVDAGKKRRKEINTLSKNATKSEHIDSPKGSEVVLDVEIVDVFAFQGSYGTSWCVKAIDKSNHHITAFSTAKWVRKLKGGEHLTIKGIIKDFQIRNGGEVELSDGTFANIGDVKTTTIKRIKSEVK